MSHTEWVIAAQPPASVTVRGGAARFPVHRIYCVGRNFAEHAKEMGAEIERGQPVFFTKPADAVVADGGPIRYPSATTNLHHEVELVVALGCDADAEVPIDAANALIFGYAVGLDLTRRDLQTEAKEKRLPWDISKGFDASAPISEVVPVSQTGHPAEQRLWLEVNGQLRQQASLAELIWDVPTILHELSKLYQLRAGDLIFMGTPAGVGPLLPGDRFRAGVDGWVEFEGQISAR